MVRIVDEQRLVVRAAGACPRGINPAPAAAGRSGLFGVILSDELHPALFKARSILSQQRLQDRAVTPGLVGAVASHGKGCVLRKGSQETEEPCGRRTLHLGAVALDETLPPTAIQRPERDLDETLGWSHLRQPDVIEIT